MRPHGDGHPCLGFFIKRQKLLFQSAFPNSRKSHSVARQKSYHVIKHFPHSIRGKVIVNVHPKRIGLSLHLLLLPRKNQLEAFLSQYPCMFGVFIRRFATKTLVTAALLLDLVGCFFVVGVNAKFRRAVRAGAADAYPSITWGFERNVRAVFGVGGFRSLGVRGVCGLGWCATGFL